MPGSIKDSGQYWIFSVSYAVNFKTGTALGYKRSIRTGIPAKRTLLSVRSGIKGYGTLHDYFRCCGYFQVNCLTFNQLKRFSPQAPGHIVFTNSRRKGSACRSEERRVG